MILMKKPACMEQPEGFIESGSKHLACLSTQTFTNKQCDVGIVKLIIFFNFLQCVPDPCVYLRDVEKNSIAILAVYIDDIILFIINKWSNRRICFQLAFK